MESKQFQSLLVIRNDKPMYEDIFHIAYAYNRSAKLVSQESERVENAAFLLPSIVCQAFAIELFLKFFLLLDYPNIKSKKDIDSAQNLTLSKAMKAHLYEHLWDAINIEYKEVVSKHYSNALNIKASVSDFRKALVDIDSNSFVNWRYIHEEESFKFMHPELTEKLSDVLLSAAFHGGFMQVENS